MNDDLIETMARRLAAEWRDFIDSERAYKITGAEVARANVEEALEGKRPWSQVFTGQARKILSNQLASNQYMNRAFASLMASDDAAIDAMVRHWWVDGDLDSAAAALDAIVKDPTREDEFRHMRGLGSRASVLAFFRLLKDPRTFPIFRPGHVNDARNVLKFPKLEGSTPAELLRSYDALLDDLRQRFAEHGLELRDRLDVQGVLFTAKMLTEHAARNDADAGAADKESGTLLTHPTTPVGTASAADIAAELPALQSWLRSRGLHYPDDLVAHFLAALLTKPFVVLSGLSGTGKTRLALEVGKCLGAVHVVPVKPDWTDTRGVLGYLNPLTGRYEVTEALSAVLAAQRTGRPVMLVLDEMNLAHVERYFADVLSAMESGEAIPLHDSDEVEQQQAIPQRLHWPQNLLLVGTVNADETTYPFSPKVLDRAFVIDVSRVDLRGYFGAAPNGELETAPNLPAFLPSRDWRSLSLRDHDLDFLHELHAALTEAGRPFGYRTVDEALAFLSHARAFDAHGLQARDALLASKVLPRLHGRRHELEPVLTAVADVVGVDLDEWEEGMELEAFPRTSGMLRGMWRQLMDEGHVASLVG